MHHAKGKVLKISWFYKAHFTKQINYINNFFLFVIIVPGYVNIR